MNILRTVKLADVFTAGNLVCGVLAIFTASNAQFNLAALLIVLAVIMDTLDGKIAKLMHQTNSFGKQLDSLADLISFGVAPAFLYYALREPGIGIVLILILFSVCGMLRLARYNVSEGEGFEGVPITVNGFLFPILYLIYLALPATLVIWPAVFAAMSVLMVSSLRLKRIF
ncbi:MAG: CDP-diacylglycerol--serine O-phosphatidyltransferase [Gammaproteobacteria bacterium]|nr:CDP-diacylglycerol--serine O-phosphatidyltransferase [Gammaproteobacteria bacterium]